MKIAPVLAVVILSASTSCSLMGEGDDTAETDSSGKVTDVVLVTHDSFSLPKRLIAEFESDTGYHLVVRASGDAGELTSKLVLTKDSPTGDAAFGVDNSFAGRALDEDVFAPYDAQLPAGTDAFELDSDTAHTLAPIDTSEVCVNVDAAWFEAHKMRPPVTLDDLADPTYEGLFVTPGAPTSSPGFAFLLATISAYGDGWQAYWRDLMANGAEITKGWEDAYDVDFTGGPGKDASRPIVLSYDSSPAFTVDEQTGKSTTAALLDTCTRQVEYAGVLAGAKNEPGAQALIEFLLTPEVQGALPASMYVFPVRDGVQLPAEWAKFATRPTTTLDVPAEDIDAHRDEWLTDWTDITSR